MKTLIPIILFTLFFNSSFSQNNHLPKCLLKPEYYNSSQYAIGVSDPLPGNPSMALEQAIKRAYINYGLLHKSKYVSLITIARANNQKSNENINMIETILWNNVLKADFVLKDSFEIVQKEYSVYGECIVLLQKSKTLKARPDTIHLSIMRSIAFYNDNDAALPVSLDKLEIKLFLNKEQQMHYRISRAQFSKYIISSGFNYKNHWEELSVKNKYRNYSKNLQAEKEIFECSENLTYGFWAAYLYALSDQICINSALNQNRIYRLVSIRQGNIQQQISASSLELLSNTKKIKSQTINIKFKNIETRNNKLIIKRKEDKSVQNLSYTIIPLNRKERKKLKTIKKEQLQELNIKNIEQAFYMQKFFVNDPAYFYATASTRSGNISLGIIKGILFTGLEIDTQYRSNILSISQLEISKNKNSAVKNSKIISNNTTNRIFPYFFFIKKINSNAYSIDTQLFYKTNN